MRLPERSLINPERKRIPRRRILEERLLVVFLSTKQEPMTRLAFLSSMGLMRMGVNLMSCWPSASNWMAMS